MKSLINKAKQGYVTLILLLWVLLAWVLTAWTDRNLEFWLGYVKGQHVDVPNWLSFLLTLVLNGVCIALNIISEIARLLVS